MEPEGSLPHSQVPITCPYPEPDQSSPSPTPILYYPSTYAWVFQVVPSIWSQHQSPVCNYRYMYLLLIPPIPFLVWLSE